MEGICKRTASMTIYWKIILMNVEKYDRALQKEHQSSSDYTQKKYSLYKGMIHITN